MYFWMKFKSPDLEEDTPQRERKTLKENIKLPQPFEDFADNHVVLYSRPLLNIRSITSLIC